MNDTANTGAATVASANTTSANTRSAAIALRAAALNAAPLLRTHPNGRAIVRTLLGAVDDVSEALSRLSRGNAQ